MCNEGMERKKNCGKGESTGESGDANQEMSDISGLCENCVAKELSCDRDVFEKRICVGDCVKDNLCAEGGISRDEKLENCEELKDFEEVCENGKVGFGWEFGGKMSPSPSVKSMTNESEDSFNQQKHEKSERKGDISGDANSNRDSSSNISNSNSISNKDIEDEKKRSEHREDQEIELLNNDSSNISKDNVSTKNDEYINTSRREDEYTNDGNNNNNSNSIGKKRMYQKYETFGEESQREKDEYKNKPFYGPSYYKNSVRSDNQQDYHDDTNNVSINSNNNSNRRYEKRKVETSMNTNSMNSNLEDYYESKRRPSEQRVWQSMNYGREKDRNSVENTEYYKNHRFSEEKRISESRNYLLDDKDFIGRPVNLKDNINGNNDFRDRDARKNYENINKANNYGNSNNYNNGSARYRDKENRRDSYFSNDKTVNTKQETQNSNTYKININSTEQRDRFLSSKSDSCERNTNFDEKNYSPRCTPENMKIYGGSDRKNSEKNSRHIVDKFDASDKYDRFEKNNINRFDRNNVDRFEINSIDRLEKNEKNDIERLEKII
ncbi:hypothetical protein EDEG_03296 [Edhazardia aedis USNM 41457]|uniref:Uncharacterized protein n=1 Tax=Edhazardia aedis (strain USNM 41457) TaxID=1003232 RepID=J9DLN1_EDHAE|nr:hypothetical protein EDEG_03296 [Edhazardia aedis USNM 41457]|eukprot:EJW02272.1 hypothetical protein EDEG_03296 [Edhazardia aedis USNM 41457]